MQIKRKALSLLSVTIQIVALIQSAVMICLCGLMLMCIFTSLGIHVFLTIKPIHEKTYLDGCIRDVYFKIGVLAVLTKITWVHQ